MTKIYLAILKSDEHIDFKNMVYQKLEWTRENHQDWSTTNKNQIYTLLLVKKVKVVENYPNWFVTRLSKTWQRCLFIIYNYQLHMFFF